MFMIYNFANNHIKRDKTNIKRYNIKHGNLETPAR